MERFLTVMAVLDHQTQECMGEMQAVLRQSIGPGTQTMGIPFHISLGTYPLSAREQVMAEMKEIAAEMSPFPIKLLEYSQFGEHVFFLKPEESRPLRYLRSRFESDFPKGLPWVPHATLFCGSGRELCMARPLLEAFPLPMKSQIVGLELGAFFPAERLLSLEFMEE